MTASFPDGAPDGACWPGDGGRDAAGGVSLPALLRGARGSYAHTITAFLARAGCDDMPQNGPYVLGGMARRQASAADMVHGLGVTRQAASQLIDTLVVRGYLSREVSPADRRRLLITLTDRGCAAAAAIRAAVAQVDEQLSVMISPAELAGLRAGLAALAAIRAKTKHDGRRTGA